MGKKKIRRPASHLAAGVVAEKNRILASKKIKNKKIKIKRALVFNKCYG
jgi:hypothetical protein